MTYFISLLSVMSFGIDPFIFIGPICLGLGACLIAVMTDLELGRARRGQARRESSKRHALLPRHPPEHDN